MSASVDQRAKGQPNQVSNGPNKDGVKDEEFDQYLQPPHQAGYNAAPMSSPGVSDPFLPSYYTPSMSFPYMDQGLGAGPWSNGGDPPMFSMTSYDYNGIFNSFGYPPFGWDYSADYWGNAAGQGQKNNRQYSEAEYYRPEQMMPAEAYTGMNGELDRDGVNSVEQGLKGMNLGEGKKMENVGNDMGVEQNGNVGVPQGPPMVVQGGGAQAPKKASWAAIASQPARPQPQMKPRTIPRAPVNPNKHNMDIGTWDNRGNSGNRQQQQARQGFSAPRRQMTPYTSGNSSANNHSNSGGNAGFNSSSASASAAPARNESHPVLDKLKSANQYNPKEYNLNPKGARFFVIKSYSEDDIHRSIKYSIWCSTEHGNKRLDAAMREREGKGPVLLLYSVNGSGHFCGMAQMMSTVDYMKNCGVWAQDKWKGQFEVKWIYVKDVPNNQLRHIRLENNENKPVTNSRDTQEVPPEKGKQILKILHTYRHTTSIFDDFIHYEKRQEEDSKKDDNDFPKED